MIKLYRFGPAFGVPDPSPFVMKVDAWMRMSGIPFEDVSGIAGLRKAPKGKLPFIENDGKVIADSHLIIGYLIKQYGSPLNEGWSAEQRAIATLVGKSIDEHLYWSLVYSRWARADSWPLTKASLFGFLPFPLRQIVPLIARSKVKRALHLQGFGRHSDEEIMAMTEEMFQALSDLLGDKPYLLADRPSTLDTTVFAFMCEFILSEVHNPVNEKARSFETLVRYCERIADEYYPPGAFNR